VGLEDRLNDLPDGDQRRRGRLSPGGLQLGIEVHSGVALALDLGVARGRSSRR
jgi:hypothetical protein